MGPLEDKVGPLEDKVGPLEDIVGNIISQGFLMAEDLNGYFSSVFTREEISSLQSVQFVIKRGSCSF